MADVDLAALDADLDAVTTGELNPLGLVLEQVACLHGGQNVEESLLEESRRFHRPEPAAGQLRDLAQALDAGVFWAGLRGRHSRAGV